MEFLLGTTVVGTATSSPFTVKLNEPDRSAPHTATFSVTGGSTPVATIEFDVDGNGTVGRLGRFPKGGMLTS